MTIHRFFITREFINKSGGFVLCQSQKLVRQVRKVLRLENGDRIDILDDQGNLYRCILEDTSPEGRRDIFKAKIIDKELPVETLGTKLTMAMPLIKASRFEWALEKLTELGVDAIAPVILSRTIAKDSHRTDRWQKIIEEASEQCERNRIPELKAPAKFLDWLNQFEPAPNNSLRLICLERKKNQLIQEVLYNAKNRQINKPLNCAIAIGAEGGFTEEEIDAAISYNFFPVSLGKNIMRSETAALYTLALARSALIEEW